MDDEYLDAVLELVATIPPGRVMTYGGIAEVVGAELGRGGPRQVGQIMARAGGGVPWWRVVNAAGHPPAHYAAEALQLLADDGCPLTADEMRVSMARAEWMPEAWSPGG